MSALLVPFIKLCYSGVLGECRGKWGQVGGRKWNIIIASDIFGHFPIVVHFFRTSEGLV